MKFSERLGLTKVRDTIQKDSIDRALRNRLWNLLYDFYFSQLEDYDYKTPAYIKSIMGGIWTVHLNQLKDEMPDLHSVYDGYKDYFFSCQWFEVYDFIQYVILTGLKGDYKSRTEGFVIVLNVQLKSFLSAYRWINDDFVPITGEAEIQSIDEALKNTSIYKSVNTHLETALKLMSDRTAPDYRNSIKESICAVESMCKIITGKEKATLGEALGVIEKSGKLHPALVKSFSNLYGYSSGSSGIRHALGLTEEADLNQDDAKYMLVSCSAFINYLISKHKT